MSTASLRASWRDRPPEALVGEALSHYQTPEYDRLLRRYGQQPCWLTLSDEADRARAHWLLFTTPGDYLDPPRGFPLSWLDLHFQGVHGPRMAGDLDSGGRDAVRRALLDALAARARGLHPVHSSFTLDPVLRDDELAAWRRDAESFGFQVSASFTYLAELPDDVEELSRRIKPDRRTKVRKAERAGGVVACTADEDAMREYYRARLDTTRRNGLPDIAWKHFADTLEVMGPAGVLKVFLARFGERVGAGQVAFVHGGYVHLAGVCIAQWAIDEGVPANDLLQWGVLRWAVDNGMRQVDFVGAAPDSDDPKRRAIDAFKARWGTELREGLVLTGPRSRLRGIACHALRRVMPR